MDQSLSGVSRTFWSSAISQRAHDEVVTSSEAEWVELLSISPVNLSGGDTIRVLKRVTELVRAADGYQILLLLRLGPAFLTDLQIPEIASRYTMSSKKPSTLPHSIRFPLVSDLRCAVIDRVARLALEQSVTLNPLLEELANRRFGNESFLAYETDIDWWKKPLFREAAAWDAAIEPAREWLSAADIREGSPDEQMVLSWLSTCTNTDVLSRVLECLPAITTEIARGIAQTQSHLSPELLVRAIPAHLDRGPLVSPAEPAVSIFDPSPQYAIESPEHTAKVAAHARRMKDRSFPLYARRLVANKEADVETAHTVRTDNEAAVLVRAFSVWGAPAQTLTGEEGASRNAEKSTGVIAQNIDGGVSPATTLIGWNNKLRIDLSTALHHLLETQQPIGPSLNAALIELVKPCVDGGLDAAGQIVSADAIEQILWGLGGSLLTLSPEICEYIAWATPPSPADGPVRIVGWCSVLHRDISLPARQHALRQLLHKKQDVAWILSEYESIRASLPPDFLGEWNEHLHPIVLGALDHAYADVAQKPESLKLTSVRRNWFSLFTNTETPLPLLRTWATSPLFADADFRDSLSRNATAIGDPAIYSMLRRQRDPDILLRLLVASHARSPKGGDFDMLFARLVCKEDEIVSQLLDLLKTHQEMLARTDRRLFAPLLVSENRDLRVRAVSLLGEASRDETPLPLHVIKRSKKPRAR